MEKLSLKEITCYHCQHHWSYDPPLSRQSSCPSCLKDAKVCRNCYFYDPHVHNECQENSADWVKNKELANYCEYFRPRQEKEQKKEQKTSDRQSTKALEALFQKPDKSSKIKESPPKNSLEDELAKFLKEKKP